MEALGSRLSRASSRYGAPAAFSGPVRKWKKKWVHVTPSYHNTTHSNNTTNANTNNNNASSRLLLRRWTPITPNAADDPLNASANVSEEPPRRKFRYTPIAVLEEQKKVVVEKAEVESTSESDQLTAKQKNVAHEMHVDFNMNEISEESKLLLQDPNMNELDLGLDIQGNHGENSENYGDPFENKFQASMN